MIMKIIIPIKFTLNEIDATHVMVSQTFVIYTLLKKDKIVSKITSPNLVIMPVKIKAKIILATDVPRFNSKGILSFMWLNNFI